MSHMLDGNLHIRMCYLDAKIFPVGEREIHRWFQKQAITSGTRRSREDQSHPEKTLLEYAEAQESHMGEAGLELNFKELSVVSCWVKKPSTQEMWMSLSASAQTQGQRALAKGPCGCFFQSRLALCASLLFCSDSSSPLFPALTMNATALCSLFRLSGSSDGFQTWILISTPDVALPPCHTSTRPTLVGGHTDLTPELRGSSLTPELRDLDPPACKRNRRQNHFKQL